MNIFLEVWTDLTKHDSKVYEWKITKAWTEQLMYSSIKYSED